MGNICTHADDRYRGVHPDEIYLDRAWRSKFRRDEKLAATHRNKIFKNSEKDWERCVLTLVSQQYCPWEI